MVAGWIAIAAIVAAMAWFAWSAWRAPTVREDRCPNPALLYDGRECGGPCCERPPCMEER